MDRGREWDDRRSSRGNGAMERRTEQDDYWRGKDER